MDNPSNEEGLNKENTLILTFKSISSKRKRQKVLQELQINQVLYTYAKIKRFVWRLQNTYKRVDGSISKKVFECRHAGKPKSYKGNSSNTSRNTTSIHVECTYYINICWPKSESNPCVTTFESQHMNHNLNIATAIFAPSYRSLPELVMNRIKFYVENSFCMGSFMIRNFLKAEFLQQTFLERDVVNAI
ncbi:unnamed protein product [Rhizophagus irregularis]|nr:unnamed protein product [Rhizophagus irregularis]